MPGEVLERQGHGRRGRTPSPGKQPTRDEAVEGRPKKRPEPWSYDIKLPDKQAEISKDDIRNNPYLSFLGTASIANEYLPGYSWNNIDNPGVQARSDVPGLNMNALTNFTLGRPFDHGERKRIYSPGAEKRFAVGAGAEPIIQKEVSLPHVKLFPETMAQPSGYAGVRHALPQEDDRWKPSVVVHDDAHTMAPTHFEEGKAHTRKFNGFTGMGQHEERERAKNGGLGNELRDQMIAKKRKDAEAKARQIAEEREEENRLAYERQILHDREEQRKREAQARRQAAEAPAAADSFPPFEKFVKKPSSFEERWQKPYNADKVGAGVGASLNADKYQSGSDPLVAVGATKASTALGGDSSLEVTFESMYRDEFPARTRQNGQSNNIISKTNVSNNMRAKQDQRMSDERSKQHQKFAEQYLGYTPEKFGYDQPAVKRVPTPPDPVKFISSFEPETVVDQEIKRMQEEVSRQQDQLSVAVKALMTQADDMHKVHLQTMQRGYDFHRHGGSRATEFTAAAKGVKEFRVAKSHFVPVESVEVQAGKAGGSSIDSLSAGENRQVQQLQADVADLQQRMSHNAQGQETDAPLPTDRSMANHSVLVPININPGEIAPAPDTRKSVTQTLPTVPESPIVKPASQAQVHTLQEDKPSESSVQPPDIPQQDLEKELNIPPDDSKQTESEYQLLMSALGDGPKKPTTTAISGDQMEMAAKLTSPQMGGLKIGGAESSTGRKGGLPKTDVGKLPNLENLAGNNLPLSDNLRQSIAQVAAEYGGIPEDSMSHDPDPDRTITFDLTASISNANSKGEQSHITPLSSYRDFTEKPNPHVPGQAASEVGEQSEGPPSSRTLPKPLQLVATEEGSDHDEALAAYRQLLTEADGLPPQSPPSRLVGDPATADDASRVDEPADVASSQAAPPVKENPPYQMKNPEGPGSLWPTQTPRDENNETAEKPPKAFLTSASTPIPSGRAPTDRSAGGSPARNFGYFSAFKNEVHPAAVNLEKSDREISPHKRFLLPPSVGNSPAVTPNERTPYEEEASTLDANQFPNLKSINRNIAANQGKSKNETQTSDEGLAKDETLALTGKSHVVDDMDEVQAIMYGQKYEKKKSVTTENKNQAKYGSGYKSTKKELRDVEGTILSAEPHVPGPDPMPEFALGTDREKPVFHKAAENLYGEVIAAVDSEQQQRLDATNLTNTMSTRPMASDSAMEAYENILAAAEESEEHNENDDARSKEEGNETQEERPSLLFAAHSEFVPVSGNPSPERKRKEMPLTSAAPITRSVSKGNYLVYIISF